MRADPGKPLPVKGPVVKVKPVVVKAPAGDVASSGGDYGMKQANQAARSAPVKRAQRAVYDQQPTAQKQRIVKNASGPVAANLAPIHAGRVARNQELAQSAATKDTKGNQDRQPAQSYLAAHPEVLHPSHPQHGSFMAAITGAAKLGEEGLKASAKLAPYVASLATPALTATTSMDPRKAQFAKKLASNAATDTAELAVTTPSSVAKLASTAVHDPGKVPGMLAKQYVDLYHDPVKTIIDRPVSTALMLDPAIKMPGRVVGKGLRVAGKQTLERAPKTLPGTALKETRTKSRDALVNALQTRVDRKGPAPAMAEHDVQRRVDAFHDLARQQGARIQAQTAKAIKKRYAHLPKADRKVILADRMERARIAARGKTDKMFAQEFGANVRPSSGAAERNAAATVRQTANQRVKVARKNVEVAQTQHTAAMTEARLALAKSKRSPQLDALAAQHRRALADVAKAQQEQRATRLQTAVKAERANTQLARTVGNARVSEVRGNRTARLAEAEAQRARAMGDVAKLAKAENRAVAADKTAAQVGLARAVGEAKVSEVRAKSSPVLAAAERDLGAAKVKLANLRKDQKGKPYSVTGAAVLRAARSTVTKHETRVRAERARIRGVAPQQAEALRSAIENLDRAKRTRADGGNATDARAAVQNAEQALAVERRRVAGLAPEQQQQVWQAMAARERAVEIRKAAPAQAGERVKVARDAARQTEQALAAQRARMAGVPPAQHDALMKAMAGETGARAELGAARAERQQARGEHIAAKQAMTNSTLVDPAQAGRLFEHKADARAVIKKLPFDATITDAGGKYAVVPRVATERLARHRNVGSSGAIGAKVMRVTGKSFRTAVLPVSSKWLTGQVTEAGQRAAVAGAGPTSWVRARKVINKLEQQQPGKGVELAQRAAAGGQFSLTSTARDFADGKRTLADEFEGTALSKPARALTKTAAAPGIRHVRQGWAHYTRVVFDVVNGTIERTAQTAMLGKAIKNSPLMERSILGLSDKAITDAANGLHGSESQVALARQVHRMYGQYAQFSPSKRETLLHTTPFYPWYRNVATFLLKVLPVDHPIQAALLADVDAATEQWRLANQLSLHGPHVPLYLLGSYPDGHGGYTRFGRYTPFAPADIAGAIGDLVFPQGSGPIENLKGIDWTGKRLQHGPHGPEYTQGERVLKALGTAAQAHVPGVAPVTRIVSRVQQGKTVGQALNKEYNPLAPTNSGAGPAPKGSVVPVKINPIKLKPIKIKPVKIR